MTDLILSSSSPRTKDEIESNRQNALLRKREREIEIGTLCFGQPSSLQLCYEQIKAHNPSSHRSKNEIDQNRQKAIALQKQRRRERGEEAENEMKSSKSLCIKKCEIRARRIGWNQAMFVSKPYGVNLRASGRYHAEFEGEFFCGCFENERDAAIAWDSKARSENYLFYNYPINYETSSSRFTSQLFQQFRSSDFPYPKYDINSDEDDEAWKIRMLSAALRYNNDFMSTKLVKRSPEDLNPADLLCYNVNKHVYEVQKTKKVDTEGRAMKPYRSSAMETFLDDTELMKSIRSIIERQGVIPVQGDGVLSTAYLYTEYGGSNGVVYDPSGGWGGRMIGAAMAGVRKYICCEPSVKTVKGLNEIKRLLGYISPMIIEILPYGSEDYVPTEEIDMTFTSPPYFHLERYADDEDTQCYKKYPTKAQFFDGFLKPTILNSLSKLKVGGYMIFNVSNTKIFTDKDIWLDRKVQEYAIESGLVEVVSPFPQYILKSSTDCPKGTGLNTQDMILVFIKLTK